MGAALEDVILRAAYCPMGGTSELVVKSIETKCFTRLRDLLRRWKATFESLYPGEPWTGPDPSQCSLHRLGGHGAIISDTCNAARKSRALLASLIADQMKEHISTEAWEAMSDGERQQAVKTHHVDCWQHLRNIFLAAMSSAQVTTSSCTVPCPIMQMCPLYIHALCHTGGTCEGRAQTGARYLWFLGENVNGLHPTSACQF